LYVFLTCSISKKPIFLPALITSIVAIIGGFVGILSLIANSNLARSKNALDFEKNLEDSKKYDIHHQQLISFKRNSNDDKSAIIDLAKNPDIDIKAYEAAIELLNWWERGANGIRCKVYRDDVLRKVYCSHLINLGVT